MKSTPIEALVGRAQAHPGETAFVFRETAWTYERVALESERLARAMALRGVRPGDRVVLHMMNRPEYIVAYYACFRLGAIAAPLRTAFKFAELEPLLRRLKPALYIGEAALYENVATLDGSILPRDRRVIVGAISQGHDGIPWGRLLEDGGYRDAMIAADVDKPAVLITTSGTTGQPKFVVHTPATLSESADLLADTCKWSRDDVMAMPLPLAHMSGLITLLTLMRAGARFVLLESFDAGAVLDVIDGHRCTIHLGFPAQFDALLACQHDRPRNLASLRYCLTGGDSCPIDLQRRVTSAFGAPLHNFWAATECVGSLSYGRRPGPVTQIVDSAHIRLVDEDGIEVAEGQIGELLVSGSNLFAGYWEDPHATAESVRDGWYRTGDLMRRKGDELTFVARKKDIIIRGGTNISPLEVEQAIVASHPGVEEAAVVGKPDSVLGQRVFGFVKLANGQSPAVVLDILDNLAERLADYKIPEQLIVLDALPRNALSKVDRNALRAIAANSDMALDKKAGVISAQVKRVAGKASNGVASAR